MKGRYLLLLPLVVIVTLSYVWWQSSDEVVSNGLQDTPVADELAVVTAPMQIPLAVSDQPNKNTESLPLERATGGLQSVGSKEKIPAKEPELGDQLEKNIEIADHHAEANAAVLRSRYPAPSGKNVVSRVDGQLSEQIDQKHLNSRGREAGYLPPEVGSNTHPPTEKNASNTTRDALSTEIEPEEIVKVAKLKGVVVERHDRGANPPGEANIHAGEPAPEGR